MEKAREIRNKIENINVAKKVTRAMDMIASFKIVKARRRILEARPFTEKIEGFITDMARYSPKVADDPLMKAHKTENVVLIIGITADRGLCGGYNANIIKLIEDTIEKIKVEGKEVNLDIIGTRGASYFRYAGFQLSKVYEHLSEYPKFLDAREIAKEIIARYIAEEVDRVIICYTRFINAMEHIPTARQILPIPIDVKLRDEKIKEHETGEIKIGDLTSRVIPEFIYDPSFQDILSSLLPEYIYTVTYIALLESTASEIGARMTAMKIASDNADEITKDLKRRYHRVRQHGITMEIAEITSGSEFLKEKGR